MTASQVFNGKAKTLISEYQVLLISGMVLGLLAANLATGWYMNNVAVHTWLFWVNEYGMSYFFARAGKEVWEAMLSSKGALYINKKDIGGTIQRVGTPVAATFGGLLMPFAIAFAGVKVLNLSVNALQTAVVPTATDIVFSLLVIKFAFWSQRGTAKVTSTLAFLTTLALLDDGAGLLMIAALFHEAGIHLLPLVGLTGGAIVLGLVANKKFKVTNHWFYFLLMHMSWVGLYLGGLPPALGFVFIIPTMPHSYNGDVYFGEEEETRTNTLDQWAHAWHAPIDVFLFVFAFVNCGIQIAGLELGPVFWVLLTAVVVGKPVGVILFTQVAIRLGFKLPEGMDHHSVVVLGFAAGIGLTVMLFVSHLAFQNHHDYSIQATAAALGSLILSGGLALAAANLGRLKLRFNQTVRSNAQGWD